MAWKIIAAVILIAQAVSSPLPNIHVLEKKLEAIRGLCFKTPVRARPATTASIDAYLSRQLKQEMDMRGWKAALFDFGFVPRSFHPQAFLKKMLEGEVLAYYDPETKHFYYKVSAAPRLQAGSERTRNTAPQATYYGGGLDLETVWLHELDHALQDQNFNLLALTRKKAFRHNQDYALAADALVEGDATLVMIEPILSSRHVSEENAESAVPLMESLAANSPDLKNAPPIFRKMLIFPYYSGLKFVLRLKQIGGWPAVNRAFTHLPGSTREVLHPDDFLSGTYQSTDFILPDVRGYTTIDGNVLGELGISALYETYFPGEKADFSQWEGDHYRIYRNHGKETVLWATLWETPAAASLFMKEQERILQKRFKGWRKTNWLKQDGDEVYLLLNVPSEKLSFWKRQILKIRKNSSQEK